LDLAPAISQARLPGAVYIRPVGFHAVRSGQHLARRRQRTGTVPFSRRNSTAFFIAVSPDNSDAPGKG